MICWCIEILYGVGCKLVVWMLWWYGALCRIWWEMQRSRKALQQRRDLKKAIGRNHLYKVSLSLVIILWGLVFLLNSWIGHGDAHQGELLLIIVFCCCYCVCLLLNMYYLGYSYGKLDTKLCTQFMIVVLYPIIDHIWSLWLKLMWAMSIKESFFV